MTTTRYRHRTAEVEAIQWTGDNADALRAFAGPDFDTIDPEDRIEDPDETAAVRESKHGTWRGLKPGDWVVRLDEGLYEFSAADFAERYEPVVSAAVPPTTRTAADRAADPLCVCGHPMRLHHEDVCLLAECGCADGREPEAADGLADRLEAALTERFTELGNPHSRMVVNEKGPDGYPATHPVGPHKVAEVLRELMAEERDEAQAQANLDALAELLPPPADRAAEWRAAAADLITAFPDPKVQHIGVIAASHLRRRARDIDAGQSAGVRSLAAAPAVLPPPADRAAVLLEAAELADVRAAGERSLSSSDHDQEEYAASALTHLANHLRRLADEAQQQPDTETRRCCGRPAGAICVHDVIPTTQPVVPVEPAAADTGEETHRD